MIPKKGHFYPKNDPIDLKISHIIYLDGFYVFTNLQPKMYKIGKKNIILGSNLAKSNLFCSFFDQNQSFWDLAKNSSTEFSIIALKVGKKLVLYDRIVILPEKILFWDQTLDGKTSRTEKPLGRKKFKM